MTTVTSAPRRRSRRPKSDGARLTLLDSFELVHDGVPIRLPMNAQRLVAFLALHQRPLLRPYVAGTLWLNTSEERAHANLRSTLWRLQRSDRGLIEVSGQQLRVSADVVVDLREVERLARSALDDTAGALELSPAAFTGDLLPDWYDDWVLIERERFRQLRLRALDVLCERLTRAGRLAEALEAGLAALAGEPLRESAHRAVIRVHLAEGNACEALRQYGFCRRLLEEHLGVEPSPRMEELIGSVTVWRRSRDEGVHDPS
ncbi:MAG TPA: BTAD domain-containing putative transcriptional regulator [Gaiellaceae bacterium]|nr:BTAD domain-containing putative transcriptional regulator [Gaiellaceae bacterium]